MMSRVWLFVVVLCLFAAHRKARAAQVDSGSVEEFLRGKSHLRMDTAAPLKVGPNSVLPPHKKHPELELVEEALRLVYHELYEAANETELLKKSRLLSARQSFFSNGLGSASEWLMGVVENSLDEFPSLPRLEAQECMKRSVCEAHNQPKKYGLIGLVLQLLFPPYAKSDESSNVVSKYQLAARYGRQSNANCGVQYDGCMLNLLDIVQALVNAFIR